MGHSIFNIPKIDTVFKYVFLKLLEIMHIKRCNMLDFKNY